MWFDLGRHRSRSRLARLRALLTGALGVGTVGFGLFTAAVGVVMLATDDERAVGLLVSLFGAMLTAAGAVGMFGGRQRWRRWSRLDSVASQLQRTPAIPPAELEHALRWPRVEVGEVLLWGACEGVVQHLPGRLYGEAAPRGPLSVGDVLDGRYRLVESVGEGGMGRVFRAVDVMTGTALALKVPQAGDTESARLAREAVLLARVEHPHVQRLRYLGTTADGSPYLVTDLLEGETLEARLERVGKLSWRDALAMVAPLVGALEATHAAGVLHRDLKPSNVFIERRPEGEHAILIDFGLAQQMGASSRLTRSGAAIGTPLYMSPEQARGELLDVRTDVYGLAQLFYEMVAGTPPSFDITDARVYERLLRQAPASLIGLGVPDALDRALTRALSKSPDDRFGDVASLGRALREGGAEDVA